MIAKQSSHTIKVFSDPHLTPPAIGQGCTRSREGGTADPNRHRGLMLSTKQGEEGESKRLLVWWHFSPQITPVHDGALLSELLNTCLLMGNSAGIPCLALLAHTVILPDLPNCLYPSPWVSSLLLFWCSPHPLQGQWVSSCIQLNCQLRLNHDKMLT